ncbi:hypothetical protein BDZ97DRAFT_1810766, partial [Flammula alnicola]
VLSVLSVLSGLRISLLSSRLETTRRERLLLLISFLFFFSLSRMLSDAYFLLSLCASTPIFTSLPRFSFSLFSFLFVLILILCTYVSSLLHCTFLPISPWYTPSSALSPKYLY